MKGDLQLHNDVIEELQGQPRRGEIEYRGRAQTERGARREADERRHGRQHGDARGKRPLVDRPRARGECGVVRGGRQGI